MSKLKVLFLCTGNSCRSQMAEGWARHLKSSTLETWSAGTAPKGVDPAAIQAMAEVGVDISEHHSKKIEDIGNVHFDHIITVCGNANQNCPQFPGSKVTHFQFDDPPHLALNEDKVTALSHYRRVRDEIREFISRLPEALPA